MHLYSDLMLRARRERLQCNSSSTSSFSIRRRPPPCHPSPRSVQTPFIIHTPRLT